MTESGEAPAAAIVAVFGSSRAVPGDPDYEAGLRCGRLLAEAGFSLMTGGYGGLMEAVSRGAATAGGTVIAVTAPKVFPQRSGANQWAQIEHPQPTISTRIAYLIDQSSATIALPGSIGTLTELMVAWNDAFVDAMGRRPPKTVVAVGPQWQRLLAEIGTAVAAVPELVTSVATVDAAVAAVVAAVRSDDVERQNGAPPSI